MKLLPIPVLVLDGGGDGGELTLRGAGGEKGGQLSGQQFLPGRLEDEAIAGQRSLGRTIELLALGEEVQTDQTTGRGDFLDGLGVKGEVRIKGLGGFSPLGGRPLIQSQGRNQHHLRGGLTVVLLTRGMLEPAFEVGPEGGHSGGALEGLGITEPT